METKTTLLTQKKNKMTLLHYAIGARTEENESDSAIRKSLNRIKVKNESSELAK